jgi:fructuronate reductase
MRARSAGVFDGADGAAQFGKAPQPADRGVAGIGPLRFRAIDVRDPLAPKLAAIAEAAGPVPDRLAPALLEVGSVFGTLGEDPRMRSAITLALAKLYEVGARQAVQELRSA